MQKAKKAKVTEQAKIINKPQPVEVKTTTSLEQINNVKQQIPTTMESIFGSISWLMLQSPAHRYLFIADYEWLVMPALQLKQFRVIRNDNKPIAYISWAYINEETESRIKKQGAPKLAPHEWNNGDGIWIIDVVTPFGGGLQILQKLQEIDFKDKQVNLLRPRKDGKGMEGVALKEVLRESAKESGAQTK